MTGKQGRKILLSAYACAPGYGSEPGVGWQWAKHLGERHELWVITLAVNRAAIEASSEAWTKRVHWIYHRPPQWLFFWRKPGGHYYFFYIAWQLGAYFLARRLCKRHALDLVHHVTFATYWLPSWMGRLPVPFVFGPVGGGESAPPGLLALLSLRQRVFERIRGWTVWLTCRVWFWRGSLRRNKVVAVTKQGRENARRNLALEHVEMLPVCGLSAEELAFFDAVKKSPRQGPVRILSIGRMVHWKGFHLGMHAFARLLRSVPDAQYWFAGGGPLAPELKRLAEELGCRGNVTFLGLLPQAELYEKFAECDVCLHPAFRESFGMACMEAMAAGLPLVCLDHGGPGTLVTPQCGIAVEPGSLPETVERLAQALRTLATDPALRMQMGENARQRVHGHFSQKVLLEKMETLYDEVCAMPRG